MTTSNRPVVTEPVPIQETVVSEIVSFKEESGIVRIVLGNEQDVFMPVREGPEMPREIVVTHRLVIAADDFRAMLLKVLQASQGTNSKLREFTSRLMN